jgi:hypothetical protein
MSKFVETYKMNDGREFTDYRSNYLLNNDIKKYLCNANDKCCANNYNYKVCLSNTQHNVKDFLSHRNFNNDVN